MEPVPLPMNADTHEAGAPAGRFAWLRSWWPRRISSRLALGFGGLVLLMLVSLTLATLQVSRIADISQHFATDDMPRLLRVQALSQQVEGVGNAIVLLMNAPRDHRVDEYTNVDQRNRTIDGIVESLRNELRDTEQESTLVKLVANRAQYAEAFVAMADEIEGNDMKAASGVLSTRVTPALKNMLAESNSLLQRERTRIESQLTQSQERFQRVLLGLIALIVLAALLAALLGWGTNESVVVPLALLTDAAKRIAGGDYASPVPATSAQEVDRVGQALNTMTDAVAQRERQIVQLAFHDPLTGLPNRIALLKLQDRADQSFNCLALADLSRLKIINETLGYATGDTLIKEVAKRGAVLLTNHPAFGGFLAHLSGGRFAFAFNALDRPSAERMRDAVELAMAEPVQCSGHSVDLSLAFGLADTGESKLVMPLEALLRNAEIALYAAKKAAVGFAWYNEAQEAARLSHLGLLSDLRVAVASSQLQMWLQPKFSLQDGLPVGAEALVRWQHPQRGFISPAEFVPFAEQVGYIGVVTHWMLNEALRTLAAWATAPHLAHLSIAVNVSTRDLQNPQFCRQAQQLIQDHGVDPQRLRLEIVESGLMEDAKAGIALLHALRDVGIKLSIDDFGTGYSSLSYLQRLPVSELKIDRSFIDKLDTLPGTQLLVKAMIEMGHGMGLMVTAEGVETQAERDTITRLGCDVMQGYLGSRPMHGKNLQAWLDNRASPMA
jgi:diguanylate cyclase (GGDEF)-like protein